jgi:amino acid transporter
MSVLKGLSSAVFLIIGLLGCAVALLGIVDPASAQMADDTDPFGTPPSIWFFLGLLVLFVAVSCLGVYVLSRLRGTTRDA